MPPRINIKAILIGALVIGVTLGAGVAALLAWLF